MLGFADTCEAPACVIPCRLASLVWFCIDVYAYRRLSLARARIVGLASGSRRALTRYFGAAPALGCRWRRCLRSCARFSRWDVLRGVVGHESVLMLRAHAHTHRLPLSVFPVGAASVLSCRASRAYLRCVAVWDLPVGYVRAALCGPSVASRPPGDRKNTTNPHQISLGPPPVSVGLRRTGFGSFFKKKGTEVDRPGVSIFG